MTVKATTLENAGRKWAIESFLAGDFGDLLIDAEDVLQEYFGDTDPGFDYNELFESAEAYAREAIRLGIEALDRKKEYSNKLD